MPGFCCRCCRRCSAFDTAPAEVEPSVGKQALGNVAVAAFLFRSDTFSLRGTAWHGAWDGERGGEGRRLSTREAAHAKNKVWPACLAPSRLGTVDSHWYVDGRLSAASAQAVCLCVCASCSCLNTVVSYIFQRVDAECGGDAYLRSELCTDPFGLQKAIPPAVRRAGMIQCPLMIVFHGDWAGTPSSGRLQPSASAAVTFERCSNCPRRS